ncbi:MAG: hypothetical protein LBB47_05205, partial [Spirochaetaceae bacterium]|nr:hypothetical protein [Spirochaetaceae bacterium]
MKYVKLISIVIIGISIVSCSTTSPAPYSFAADEAETAKLNIVRGNPGLAVVYVDGDELPPPAEKTYWDPLIFPPGKPINITVHAYYQQSTASNQGLLTALITSAIVSSRSVDRDVSFECPPLEAGKNYKLVFRKGAGTTGKNLLVLTDTSTGKTIHNQEFESK